MGISKLSAVYMVAKMLRIVNGLLCVALQMVVFIEESMIISLIGEAVDGNV